MMGYCLTALWELTLQQTAKTLNLASSLLGVPEQNRRSEEVPCAADMPLHDHEREQEIHHKLNWPLA